MSITCVFSASPSDLVRSALDVAVITPSTRVISNLAVTSSPVTESYALISLTLTVKFSLSYLSVTPTDWIL